MNILEPQVPDQEGHVILSAFSRRVSCSPTTLRVLTGTGLINAFPVPNKEYCYMIQNGMVVLKRTYPNGDIEYVSVLKIHDKFPIPIGVILGPEGIEKLNKAIIRSRGDTVVSFGDRTSSDVGRVLEVSGQGATNVIEVQFR